MIKLISPLNLGYRPLIEKHSKPIEKGREVFIRFNFPIVLKHLHFYIDVSAGLRYHN